MHPIPPRVPLPRGFMRRERSRRIRTFVDLLPGEATSLVAFADREGVTVQAVIRSMIEAGLVARRAA